MKTNEDYAKARTLATIEHCDETFRVVKRRINGKPWRGYLALVYGDTFVAGCDGITDVGEATALFLAQLTKLFATRNALLTSLRPILEQYKPTPEN